MNKNLSRIYTKITELDSKAAENTAKLEQEIKTTRTEKQKLAEQLKDVISPSEYNRIKADIAKLDNTLEFLNLQKQKVATSFSDTEAAELKQVLNTEHEQLLSDTAAKLNKLATEAVQILQEYDRNIEDMNFIGSRVNEGAQPFQLMQIYASINNNRNITTEIVQGYYRKMQFWRVAGIEPPRS